MPGGYGFGLTTLKPASGGYPASYGGGIQYDFGQKGYRTVSYPSDDDYSLDSAPLDHQGAPLVPALQP